jgi:hypothetical protein
METYIGFDVGIKTSSSTNHPLTIGNLLTKLFGEKENPIQRLGQKTFLR